MSVPSDPDDLRDRLRALRAEPVDGPANAEFAASLHRKLVAAGAPDEPSFWRRLWPAAGSRAPLLWSGFAGAAVCALLILIALSHKQPHRELQAEAPLAAAEFPASQVAMVRVNLSASVAVQSALIRVTLPDGLVFWSEGQALAQRSFEWSQPLNSGDNDIPIAVRGLRPGRYQMTVTAKMGKEQVEDKVLLEVVSG